MLRCSRLVVMQSVIGRLDKNITVGIAFLRKIVFEQTVMANVAEADPFQSRDHRKIVAAIKASGNAAALQAVKNIAVRKRKPVDRLPLRNLRNGGAVIEPS